ncbi:MAG: hypothetical protein Q9175_000118 [Cornicularia normoerica]
MKSSLFVVLCSGLLALVASFTKDDHEIFRLRDEIEASEGPEVTFYDFLGVKASASQDEIVKAYRKKSRTIHPDKAKQSLIASKAKATSKPILGLKNKKPGVHVNKAPTESEIQIAVKKASERYARLGVIAEVLKGSGRERYDFFLSNGFPKWRGTGYYYARFRPGLGSVLVGLFAFGGGLVHYAAMYVSWQRQRDYAERIIRDARRSAWGDDSGIKGIPGIDDARTGTTASSPASLAQENGAAVLNRRQKRMQEREDKKEKDKKTSKGIRRSGTSTPTSLESEPEQGPQGAKKKVQAPNGKVLIVDSVGNVYVEEEDENGERVKLLLDPEEIPKPTFRQTILFRLPVWTYNKIQTRIAGVQSNYEQAESEDLETIANGEDGDLEMKRDSRSGAARKRVKRNGKAH